mmetsp:Transcript_69519/g.201803  ORF Transcript_69519/g.201803 Transcript_69519/m.201803 type:complete len:206 (-) Transcript_69519:201-818(-)
MPRRLSLAQQPRRWLSHARRPPAPRRRQRRLDRRSRRRPLISWARRRRTAPRLTTGQACRRALSASRRKEARPLRPRPRWVRASPGVRAPQTSRKSGRSPRRPARLRAARSLEWPFASRLTRRRGLAPPRMARAQRSPAPRRQLVLRRPCSWGAIRRPQSRLKAKPPGPDLLRLPSASRQMVSPPHTSALARHLQMSWSICSRRR